MNLYVHIPFCRRACGYCDFTRTITKACVDDYTNDISNEMRRRKEFADTFLRTIYIGGGTPSIVAPEALQGVIECAKSLWDCSAVEEITIEANPDDLSDSYLEQLAKTDFGRLSIGIQSFNNDELRTMNRRHTAQQAIDAVERARKWGFRNISIDLILGLPNSTVQTLQHSINQALALEPEHISAYHLSIESGTAFERRGMEPVDEQISVAQYNMLHSSLVEAGFEHYEISNFARPGYRSIHNCAYWDGTPYLGVGRGAHSYDGHRVRSYDGEQEILTGEELYEEFVMLRLRTSDGLNLRQMCKKMGDNAAARFENLARPLVMSGMLILENDHYRIPHNHWFISDTIIGHLI